MSANGFWIVRVQARTPDNDTYYGPFTSEERAQEAMENNPVIATAVEDDCEECYLVFVNNLHALTTDADNMNVCQKCRQVVTQDGHGSWVDDTDGDACPEGGVHVSRKPMVEYDQIVEGYKFEGDPQMCDTAQATVWVLHLNVHPSVKDAVLERMSELRDTTGFYNYGDSFEAWGETSQGDDDKHLAIYFRARHPLGRAYLTGAHLWAHATVAGGSRVGVNFAVSTAGDFAEQIEA